MQQLHRATRSRAAVRPFRGGSIRRLFVTVRRERLTAGKEKKNVDNHPSLGEGERREGDL
jgi:hypothetical protein